MRKTILITVAVLFVIGAGVLSVQHYNKYQTKVAQQNTIKAEAEAKLASDKKTEAEAKQARILDAYTKVRIECEKGLGAHGKLTTFQKQGIPQPNCGSAVIQ